MARTKILVIDDEKLVRWSLHQKLMREGYEVESAPTGEEGLNMIRDDGFDVVLLDLRLPGMDGVEVLREIQTLGRSIAVIVITAETAIAKAVECVRLGACNYLCKPFEFDEVKLAIDKAREELKLRREVSRVRERQQRAFALDNIVGISPIIRETRELLARVAGSDAGTVLIEGDNGTGKELAARAIHFGSKRATQPFMDLNCSAVPETLFESELFGHDRGAFTDAKTTKRGLLELADGGTVLLDEIGDMKPSLQAKLLRVLETRQFRRIGGQSDITVDVRIIASTNRNLMQAVETGAFRRDLYYRLKGISVRMPTLQERPEDIPVLAARFLEHFAREYNKPMPVLATETLDVMRRHSWPGNVRELRNMIERLVILESEPVIHPRHLPPELHAADPAGHWLLRLPPNGVHLNEVERELIIQAMERAGKNQTRAAELLGIERDALRRRLIKYGYLEPTSSA